MSWSHGCSRLSLQIAPAKLCREHEAGHKREGCHIFLRSAHLVYSLHSAEILSHPGREIAFSYNRAMIRLGSLPLLVVFFLALAGLAQGETNFDLIGPTLDVRV